MNIGDFLSPVDPAIIQDLENSTSKSLFKNIQIHKSSIPELSGIHMAIIGIADGRASEGNENCSHAADSVRSQLYKLISPRPDIKVADLGNIEAGATLQDTHFAVREITATLIKEKIIPVFIGGSINHCYAQYEGYRNITRNLRLVCVDPKIELAHDEEESQRPYLSKIILHEPNFLFNITHLGSQTYFVEQESLLALEKMNFDVHRLGQVKANIEEVEPLVRSADMLVFNMASVRSSDSPAYFDPSPNGFFGDEACKITRYAGMSNEISSAGFFEMNPQYDQNQQSAKLLAQMIWYFIDGYYNRKNDYPTMESADFVLYRTTFRNSQHEIIFYKSKKSDRWWMEVPYPSEKSSKKGKYLVPCSYADYQTACNDELPDRWLKTYEKLI